MAEVLAAPPTAEAARLLGWRNVLPVARVESVREGRAEVRLAGGQRLTALAAHDAHDTPHQGAAHLALRADALELAAETATATEPGDTTEPPQSLAGTVRGCADMGAYFAVTVGLADTPAELPPVELACSPREWAALGVGLGARVGVRVPLGAARLVSGG
jgi:hypothetical protein